MTDKIAAPLVEVRCISCGKLLCYVSGTVEVKCAKCGTINKKTA